MICRALCAALVGLAITGFHGGGAVQYFAVGNKQRVADAVTYQTYHDKMAALMDASFPGRASFVQAGVDDVASHLLPADRGRRRTRSWSFRRTSGSSPC
jgi:hypothetical protein